MKKFIILFLITLFISAVGCRQNAIGIQQKKDTVYIEKETVVFDTKTIDSLEYVINAQNELLIEKDNYVKVINDSLNLYKSKRIHADDINKTALIQIRSYVRLCEKRSENKKFLLGWIKRALYFTEL